MEKKYNIKNEPKKTPYQKMIDVIAKLVVKELLNGKLISGVKIIKEFTDGGLKECKQLVDEFVMIDFNNDIVKINAKNKKHLTKKISKEIRELYNKHHPDKKYYI